LFSSSFSFAFAHWVLWLGTIETQWFWLQSEWSPGLGRFPYASNYPKGSFRCMNHWQSTHHSAFVINQLILIWFIVPACRGHIMATNTTKFTIKKMGCRGAWWLWLTDINVLNSWKYTQKPVERHWWTCGDKVIRYDQDSSPGSFDHLATDLHT
jgi:hypothetical protein